MSGALQVDARLKRGTFELAAAFEAPMRGITVLFGPSGAGKSLLLSAIAGLAKLDAGRVAIGADVLEDAGAGARAPAHVREIGVVFQEARLFPHLTVRGNLAYAVKRAPMAGSIDETAGMLDIAGLLDRPVRNLSGGEKARVALARALLSRSRLLLLDEPFAALDGVRRRAFLNLLMSVSGAQSLPMIVVTHQIEDAAALADHTVAMREGRVLACGAAGEVMASAELRGLLDARDVGSRLPVAMLGDAAGQARGAWVRADNVLVAVEAPRGLSARHVWAGTVAKLEREATGSVLVTLGVESRYILARITQAAADELRLAEGRPAWAVVKAHAV